MKKQLLFLGLIYTFGLLAISCSNSSSDSQAENNHHENHDEQNEVVEEKKSDEIILKGYQIGDMVEDFSLKNVDGEMISMASFEEANGFVLVFTCNHCPYSIAYEDRLIELDKTYKEQGYPMIAINPNDPAVVPEDGFDEMIARSEEKGFTFPYVFDEGQLVYPKFGAEKTPHVYVVQKVDEGMKLVYVGAIDDNRKPDEVKETYLSNALDALIAGNDPSPAVTKAFGCSVKCVKKEEG